MRHIAAGFIALLATGVILFIVPQIQSQPPQGSLRGGEARQGQRRGNERSPRGGFPFPPPPVLSALDTDKDGEISADEIENAPKVLKTLDKNQSGDLADSELMPEFGGRGFPGGGPPRGGRRRGFGGGFNPFGGSDPNVEPKAPEEIEFRDGVAVIPDHKTFQKLSYLDEDLNDTDLGYLPLNVGETYGRLRLMELDDRPDPRDVVLYRSLPNELTRVAGIITAVRQTPLSHVNLRAIQDRVPNAYIDNAAESETLQPLIGKYVSFKVTADGYEIREATSEEVDVHFDAVRPAKTQTPRRDLSTTQIRSLSQITFEDSSSVGVKAANVATLGSFGFPQGTVPQGFAVPFYFYDEFYRIDHFATAMGVLVHPNYKGELANGVAVTDDVLYQTEGNYYLNTQVGADLVTNPDEASIPEEILLDWGDSSNCQVLRTSSRVSDGKQILSAKQLEKLRNYLAKIHARFARLYGRTLNDENFAMEIEFKITCDGELAIKQARPWVYVQPELTRETTRELTE